MPGRIVSVSAQSALDETPKAGLEEKSLRPMVDRLAELLNDGGVKWARVTGRDEIEIAVSRNGQSYLILKPDGTWSTQGMRLALA